MTDKIERILWSLILFVIFMACLYLLIYYGTPIPEGNEILTGMPEWFYVARFTFWTTVFLLGYIWYHRRKYKQQQNQEKELLQ
jgi:uncharacterized membrane protein